MWKAEGDKTERENRSRIVLCSCMEIQDIDKR